MKAKYKFLLCCVLLGFMEFAIAQNGSEMQDTDAVVIPPLFEYIEAPDDLPDLQSRTNFLMDNFWSPFDFNNVTTVDQNALNHAFEVYAGAMAYASPDKVQESVKSLISKIKDNPGLTFQFTKAAEESLFGPRADIWYDDVYLQFLKNLIDNNSISAAKKSKYATQLKLLQNSAVGNPFPSFNMNDEQGKPAKLSVDSPYTLIEFLNPDSDDSRYQNLKLDISGIVNDLMEDGKLKVIVIFLQDEVGKRAHPEKWKVFAAPGVNEVLDIRTTPSFYILEGSKIVGKNLNIDDAINLLSSISLKN